ncbi:hypothetical protein GCM10009133_15040 [Cocleimonas flava]|uniref:Uncharacterized protein n=1 Tax=Cocleimonas flava TaxID=634765 RepID=A0A4R1F5B0_9GAMM|nr:hypothetical protein [Cocleimonas flava]TCJ87872.1 hypothetical protein EV695_2388 [Cocleimonas flava]
MNAFGIFLLIIGTIVGLFYGAISGQYAFLYLTHENPGTGSQSELLMGVAFPLLIACPAWLSASLGAYLNRHRLKNWLQLVIYSFAFLSSSLLLYFLIFG